MPMKPDAWLLVRVKLCVQSDAADEAIAALTADVPGLGCALHEEPDGTIADIYFPNSEDAAAIAQRLQDAARRADVAIELLDSRQMPRENWHDKWREFFKSVRVSDTLVICPSWERDSPAGEGTTNILIEPGMAFGTGTHATTQLCLRLAERFLLPGDLVLDMGTGSGVLLVAAAKLGARYALGFDFDPDVRENLALNLTLNGVDASKAGAYIGTSVALSAHRFDLVFCNMLSHEFMPLLDEIALVLAPGGRVLLSGFLTSEEKDVRAAVRPHGFHIAETDRLDEWSAFVLTLHRGVAA